jgi:hypothetical protein
VEAVTTLADFLLARIGEDQAANRPGPEPEDWCDRAEGLHLGHARVLAECDAKRRIVTWAEETWPDEPWWYADRIEPVLRYLALPYADHNEYRPEWKPT